MRTVHVILAATIAATTLTAPVCGQSLEERIAAVKRQRAEEAKQRRLGSTRTGILQALLYRNLSVEFNATPARDVLKHLATTLDINIVARFSDDPVGHGIDPELPISLSVKQMPAIDVLGLVLEQCGDLEACTWQLRPSFLEVGTKERLSASGARETRVYPVDDLLYEAPRFDDAPGLGVVPLSSYAYPETFGGSSGGFGGGVYGGGSYGGGGSGAGSGLEPNRGSYDPNTPEEKAARGEALVDMIMESVEPEAWAVNGGEWATITYRDGSLVVNAPDFIHRQIGGYPRVPPPARPKPAGK